MLGAAFPWRAWRIAITQDQNLGEPGPGHALRMKQAMSSLADGCGAIERGIMALPGISNKVKLIEK